jgi:hypothetical protein
MKTRINIELLNEKAIALANAISNNSKTMAI